MSLEELESAEYRTARRQFWERAAIALVAHPASHAAFRADEIAAEWDKRFPPPAKVPGVAYYEYSELSGVPIRKPL